MYISLETRAYSIKLVLQSSAGKSCMVCMYEQFYQNCLVRYSYQIINQWHHQLLEGQD